MSSLTSTSVITTSAGLAPIPFVDLHAQYVPLRDEILGALADVLDNMHLFLGPNVHAFEHEFAEYCGTTEAIGVSNGTDAIELALRALDIGAGDEVITQPNSFIATAEAISAVGATPVFVDVDLHTSSLNPTLLEAAITSRTKAVIPVHLYGRPADMPAIITVARKHGIAVIEDACQAHGAMLNGRRAGSLGDLGCFSFYYSKNLGAYGESGAVTTNDPKLAEKVRLYRDHGSRERYQHAVVGRNSRLDEMQAAILRIKLRHLERWNEQRRANAAKLSAALEGTSPVLPTPGGDIVREVFHLYVVRHSKRDMLKDFLTARGISVGIHYPHPIHLQPAYSSLGYTSGSFPVTEQLASQILSLPMYAELTDDQITRIADAIRAFDNRTL